jgi:hypothetical protein
VHTTVSVALVPAGAKAAPDASSPKKSWSRASSPGVLVSSWVISA